MRKLTKKFALPVCMAVLVCAVHAQDTQAGGDQNVLRIVGAPALLLPVKDAADVLKKDQNLTLQLLSVLSTNAEKVGALGEGAADVALNARPLNGEERSPYPDIDFHEIQFGADAAALAVSRDVWDGGVHALTKEQVRDIYERKVKNWKEVGGPNVPIVGYSPDPARGIWTCYIQWLYDDPASTRENHFPVAKTDDEAKAYLESTAGCVAPVSMLYAEANKLHVLGIKGDKGKVVQPSAAAVADQSYPIARPLIMVVKGRPLGDVGTFVKFMVSDAGQQLVHKYNYLTLKELGIQPPSL